MLRLYTCNFNYLISTFIRWRTIGFLFLLSYSISLGQDLSLSHSDGKLVVKLNIANVNTFYRVKIESTEMLEDSPLMPKHVIEFRKHVPTLCDETVFVDGYADQYVVLSRSNRDQWSIAKINTEAKEKEIEITFSMISGKPLPLTNETKQLESTQQIVPLKRGKTIELTLQPHGGSLLFG